jgi:hypothetical protein
MSEIFSAIGRVFGSLARALQWTMSPVEDVPEKRTVPMPGPAHGPLTAIDVRLGRRRTSS